MGTDVAYRHQGVSGEFGSRCSGQGDITGIAAAGRDGVGMTPAASGGRKGGVWSDPRHNALRSRSVFIPGSQDIVKRSLHFKNSLTCGV